MKIEIIDNRLYIYEGEAVRVDFQLTNNNDFFLNIETVEQELTDCVFLSKLHLGILINYLQSIEKKME